METDLHMTAVRDLLRILKCFRRVGEECPHLLFRFYIELAALVAHPVLIRNLLSRLNAEKDIMRFRILCPRIMTVVRADQVDAGFLMHSHQLLVHALLLRQSVILKFQEKIAAAEDFFIAQRGLFSFLVLPVFQTGGHLTGKTGGKRNQSLMIFLQQFQIDAGFVVESLHKSAGYDSHQIVIAGIIFGKENQVIVSLLSAACFLIETGPRGHIDFASDHRFDALGQTLLIKLNAAVHHTVIRDGSRIHSEFLYPRHIIFYFVGTVQK